MATPAPEAAVRGGVRVGRVLGVPVLVSPSWLLFAAFVVLSYGPAADRPLRDDPGVHRRRAPSRVLLLVSVLLHEIGHCVVARAFGLPVRSITVTFLAGLTEITEPPQTPAREYAVAVIGPMVSLLLAGLGLASLPLFEPDSLPFLLAADRGRSRTALVAGFNLLPGLPLDGGRVLRAAVWKVTGDPDRSTGIAAWAGRGVAVVVVPVLLLGVLPASRRRARRASAPCCSPRSSPASSTSGASASLQRAKYLERLPRAERRRPGPTGDGGRRPTCRWPRRCAGRRRRGCTGPRRRRQLGPPAGRRERGRGARDPGGAPALGDRRHRRPADRGRPRARPGPRGRAAARGDARDAGVGVRRRPTRRGRVRVLVTADVAAAVTA